MSSPTDELNRERAKHQKRTVSNSKGWRGDDVKGMGKGWGGDDVGGGGECGRGGVEMMWGEWEGWGNAEGVEGR